MLHFDAVIFDLDGVVTKTAIIHGIAWKTLFDEYMKLREERDGEPFREFTHSGDYLPFVDGKPRYKGVNDFLQSRGINIPFGDVDDDPDKETCCGLGNRKNIHFTRVLEQEGAQVYESTVRFMEDIRARGLRLGVASSSKNCEVILKKAGLMHLVETRVDGVVSADTGLEGKPAPDIFTTACDNLGIEYHRAIIVEDATSGVQAGRAGNFGMTLGLAREDNIQDLLINGADIVLEDIGDKTLEDFNEWFISGIEKDNWSLTYHDYDQENEKSREALLSIGNGYFGSRGALMESKANKINYPGTYVHGLFNRLSSKVGDRAIENEDFVNLPNWLSVKFSIDGGKRFEIEGDSSQQIVSIQRRLDFKTGELKKEMVVEDEQGKQTKVVTTRFASMANEHVAGLSYAITPLNYSGSIELCSELRGDQINAGVERYGSLNQQHLKAVSSEASDGNAQLLVSTTSSDVIIAQTAKHSLSVDAESAGDSGDSWTRNTFTFKAEQGKEVVLEKVVSIFTSQDSGVENAGAEADKLINALAGYQAEFDLSAKAWEGIWNKVDVEIKGDRLAQKLIRLHLYHTMSTASSHTAKMDVGICPRGLTGEAYRGHIFWDELYILPFYNMHYPEVSKSVLSYRYNRLDAARAYANEYGYKGAMFPWQSGSDGREETQVVHLNPLNGEWGDDYSSLQRHVSLAIAYNVWNYFWSTKDVDFMASEGAELFLDICRFWVSKSSLDEADGRYHIDKVMGPDEFHEMLPGSDEGGVTDNAYTNIMVSWSLKKAVEILDALSEEQATAVKNKLQLSKEELNQWQEIRTTLALNITDEGIIEQFKGYFGLEELDWDGYREKYDNIHRMDRILKAEGKSADDYKLAKQADLLMTFYNLPLDEVTGIINEMGYQVPKEYLKRNFDYYMARTSHGSTLSKIVHASLAIKLGDAKLGWDLYLDALKSDLVDVQGGTTGDGIHCGVMTGTVNAIVRDFCQVDLLADKAVAKPILPAFWKGLKLSFQHRGDDCKVEV